MAVLRDRAKELQVSSHCQADRLSSCEISPAQAQVYLTVYFAPTVSFVDLSRPGGLPGRLWPSASGPCRETPALQRLPGPAAEPQLAAEEAVSRWDRLRTELSCGYKLPEERDGLYIYIVHFSFIHR